jgi:hypothetical protein
VSEMLDAYMAARARMEVADKTATTITKAIHAEIGPLLMTWKPYYLVGLGDVPSSLVLGGQRKPIDISQLPNQWPRLQTAMSEYAEAQRAAMDAHKQIPAEEKRELAPPPWLPTRR